MSSDSSRAADLRSDETLLHLNRSTLLRQTVRTIAHELNNIFQLVAGSAELMGMNPSFPDQLRKKLAVIATQSARGTELVDELATLARQDAPRGSVVDVGRAVKRVIGLRRFELTRAAIAVKVDVPETPVVARADPIDVFVMLLNLVVNAEQAMSDVKSRRLEIQVSRSGDECRVTITDSGGGAPDDLDLFAPLTTTKPFAGAAGLGLPATRVLAQRYGGRVDVSPRHSGFAVALTLPVAEPRTDD